MFAADRRIASPGVCAAFEAAALEAKGIIVERAIDTKSLLSTKIGEAREFFTSENPDDNVIVLNPARINKTLFMLNESTEIYIRIT